MFRSAGCSLLRAEDLSCNLDVLYGHLGMSKMQFLIKNEKYQKIFPAVSFFFSFWSSKPWIRINIQPKLMDPDPGSMNPDPKH
jgi:hypothetical protein